MMACPIEIAGKGELYAMPMPAAENLERQIHTLRQQGIGKLVCLLEEAESENLGLRQERSVCESAGIGFERFAIADFGVPDLDELYPFAKRLTLEIESGCVVVVHCRAGIGRTGLLCCCILVASGMSADRAMAHASAQRGCTVPETESQVRMIEQFANRCERE